MVKIEIDNNIEMSRKGRSAKWQRFPFSQLDVGDSFHIKTVEVASQFGTLSAGAKAFSMLAIQAGKRLSPRKFAVRTVTDQDPRGPGVRVWRQEDASAASGLDSLFNEKGEGHELATVAPEPRTFKGHDERQSKKVTASARGTEQAAKPTRRRAKAQESAHAAA